MHLSARVCAKEGVKGGKSKREGAAGAGGDEKQKKTRDGDGALQKKELEKERDRWMRALRMKGVDGAKNGTGSS